MRRFTEILTVQFVRKVGRENKSEMAAKIAYELMGAVDLNMGIGKDGHLPWKIKSEFEYYGRITSTTQDPTKKNVLVMGRRCWEDVPESDRPLFGCINFIMTSSKLDVSKYQNVHVFSGWEPLEKKLLETEFQKQYERVWIAGGTNIYADAMKSKYFHRVYLSRVQNAYECDTWFPPLVDHVKRVTDQNVPQGVQEENGVKWEVEVYENTKDH